MIPEKFKFNDKAAASSQIDVRDTCRCGANGHDDNSHSCNSSHRCSSCCCKLQPWLVVFSAASFFFYIYIHMNLFNAIGPAISKEFSFDALQLSKLATYYFWGNLLFLFPAGISLDRFSIRKLLAIATMLCILFTYIFATTDSLIVMNIARFCTGLTGAFCFIPAIKLASRWFPPNRIALVVGLITTVGMLGGIVAQTPLILLTDVVGWRNAVLVVTGLGALFFLIVIAFVRDYPIDANAKLAAQPEPSAQPVSHSPIAFWYSLRMVLKSLQTWFAGIYISLLNLPFYILGGTWGVLYLVQAHGLSRSNASYVTSMLFLGIILGSPIVGWISDKLGLRRLPMMVGVITAVLLMMIIVYCSGLSFTMLAVLFFLLGVIGSAQVIGYPLVNENNHPKLTATANALSSSLIVGSGTLTPVFGALLDARWDHKIIDGVAVYAASDYRLAMTMFLVAFIIGLIVVFFIKETYCRNVTTTNTNVSE